MAADSLYVQVWLGHFCEITKTCGINWAVPDVNQYFYVIIRTRSTFWRPRWGSSGHLSEPFIQEPPPPPPPHHHHHQNLPRKKTILAKRTVIGQWMFFIYFFQSKTEKRVTRHWMRTSHISSNWTPFNWIGIDHSQSLDIPAARHFLYLQDLQLFLDATFISHFWSLLHVKGVLLLSELLVTPSRWFRLKKPCQNKYIRFNPQL